MRIVEDKRQDFAVVLSGGSVTTTVATGLAEEVERRGAITFRMACERALASRPELDTSALIAVRELLRTYWVEGERFSNWLQYARPELGS